MNQNGRVVSLSYGRVTSVALDPVEKKPFARWQSGKFILSVGTFGCNLSCAFCQNASISQVGAETETEMLSPIIAEMIVRRKELGLNQRELAEKCGVPQSTIARMESGAVTPKTETLLKACRELGLRLTVERI